MISRDVLRILDVGCGYGFLLQRLKARYFKNPKNIRLEMYGIDISPFMVENAKRNVPEGKFCCCPAESLPFEDNSFKNVVCSEVIEHVINPRKTVHELARVTAYRGALIITTPNYSGYALSMLRFLKKYERIPFLHRLRMFLQKYSDFTVKNEEIPLYLIVAWLKENNLSLIKVVYLTPLVEQNIFFPRFTSLWRLIVKATKILEKIPILNRVFCNQMIIVTLKGKGIGTNSKYG